MIPEDAVAAKKLVQGPALGYCLSLARDWDSPLCLLAPPSDPVFWPNGVLVPETSVGRTVP